MLRIARRSFALLPRRDRPWDGSLVWEAHLAVSPEARLHPTATNRGVAVADGRVYVATLDARLVALDADTGEVLWERRTADPAAGHGYKQAPVAAAGRVYVGVSGSPFGIRGFVKAFEGETGREVWTWHSIPSPEEGGWWGEWRDTLPGTSIPLPRDIDAERAGSARYAERRGTLSGELGAWDAGTGQRLWSGEVGVPCASAPITCRTDRRQMVALTCGGHFLAEGVTEGRVVAFALPER